MAAAGLSSVEQCVDIGVGQMATVWLPCSLTGLQLQPVWLDPLYHLVCSQLIGCHCAYTVYRGSDCSSPAPRGNQWSPGLITWFSGCMADYPSDLFLSHLSFNFLNLPPNPVETWLTDWLSELLDIFALPLLFRAKNNRCCSPLVFLGLGYYFSFILIYKVSHQKDLQL